MKIMHILPMNKLSGAEKLALEICKNMKQHEIIVVCGGDELKKFFDKNNIKSYTVKFNEIGFKNSINELKNIIVTNSIDIIHAHDNNASLKAFATKKRYRLNVK